MQLHDPNDMMLITPIKFHHKTKEAIKWSVISRGELEGWIHFVQWVPGPGPYFYEFAHVDDPSNWLPAGNSISEVRDFIIAKYP